MRYFITVPFNYPSYRRILDEYWSGKNDNNGSLGFYRKSDKSKRKKFCKYFFKGRVPISCMDYTPPFSTNTFFEGFDNIHTDWRPTIVDDMIVTFSWGDGERLCSQYIWMVDELRDNDIIRWEENGATMIGAFDALTGGISVAIQWTVVSKYQKHNKRLADAGLTEGYKKPDKPKLIVRPEFKVDPHYSVVPIPVNWSLYSKSEGLRGINFAVNIEKEILGDLVEKRLKTHMITLKKYIKSGDMERATNLGIWVNKLRSVLANCRDQSYHV